MHGSNCPVREDQTYTTKQRVIMMLPSCFCESSTTMTRTNGSVLPALTQLPWQTTRPQQAIQQPARSQPQTTNSHNQQPNMRQQAKQQVRDHASTTNKSTKGKGPPSR
eukprot:5631843-Amphidinium_carterae.2